MQTAEQGQCNGWASVCLSIHLSVRLSAPAIDRYFLRAGRTAANLPAAVAVVDRWETQSDSSSSARRARHNARSTALSSKCGQLHIDSQCGRLNTDLL